jgi:hypothetical protein
MFANSEEGTQMSKKQKQSRKATKISKRARVLAQAEDETDTAINAGPAEAPQATPAIPEPEVVVESQQAAAAVAPATPPTPATPSNPATRSEAAKANIKEGLRLHQIAGRPTKGQLILVFGKAGYLLTWPKRTEKFGITPETFQTAFAEGVLAVPLTPVAKPNVEKTKGTA